MPLPLPLPLLQKKEGQNQRLPSSRGCDGV
jgi:hypothetical protein